MKTIHWYTVSPASGWQEINVPQGATFLRLGTTAPSHGLRVWALVDTDEPIRKTKIAVLGTEWEVPSDADFVDSHISDSSEYVWHLFVPKPWKAVGPSPYDAASFHGGRPPWR